MYFGLTVPILLGIIFEDQQGPIWQVFLLLSVHISVVVFPANDFNCDKPGQFMNEKAIDRDSDRK